MPLRLGKRSLAALHRAQNAQIRGFGGIWIDLGDVFKP